MAYIGSPWEHSDLISRRGLAAWYMSDAHNSGSSVHDSSGSGRTLAPTGTAPAMSGTRNGKTAFYLSGVSGRNLTVAGDIPGGVRHVFIIAAYDGVTFPDYAGLIGGNAYGDVLVGSSASNFFMDLGAGASFRRNDLATALSPMSAKAALVEWRRPGGIPCDGVLIGHQRAVPSRTWTGPFWEAWVYSVDLTPLELLGIHRYAAMKYHIFQDFDLAGLKIFPFPTEWSRSLTAAKQVLMSRSISGKIKQRSKTTEAKRTIEASFDERRFLEYDTALAFHTEHYGVKSFVFRDYTRSPAVDLEAYFASAIQERPDGFERTSYGFTLAEK